MATAANLTSPWLFPGYRPGQPLTHDYLMQQLRGAGLPLRSAKNGALRHLVLAMSSAIAAQTLGYSTTAAEQHAKHSGATWSAYPTAHQSLNTHHGDAPTWRKHRHHSHVSEHQQRLSPQHPQVDAAGDHFGSLDVSHRNVTQRHQ